MADENGDYRPRFERMERMVEQHNQQIAGLIDHAHLVNQQIEKLRGAQLETSAAVKGLVGAIRDLIDRIPPENLR